MGADDSKIFEVTYLVSGSLKTSVKATDANDAAIKASLATKISSVITNPKDLIIDSVIIDKITDDQGNTYKSDDDNQ